MKDTPVSVCILCWMAVSSWVANRNLPYLLSFIPRPPLKSMDDEVSGAHFALLDSDLQLRFTGYVTAGRLGATFLWHWDNGLAALDDIHAFRVRRLHGVSPQCNSPCFQRCTPWILILILILILVMGWRQNPRTSGRLAQFLTWYWQVGAGMRPDPSASLHLLLPS